MDITNSPYSKEGEFLFMAGFVTMQLVNIINTKTGDEWIKYIKPLRLIDTMATGCYFIDNPSDIHKMISMKSRNVNKLKLSPLSDWDNQMCRCMMGHQMATNGYLNESKSIKLYPKIFCKVPYVERLLNNICDKRKIIMINVRVMNAKILNECEQGNGGYIGYSFCEKVFLCDDYHGINLNAFHALFRNLQSIFVRELKSISSEFLEDIFVFLKKKNDSSQIDYIELHIDRDSENIMDLKSKCDTFRTKFESIGFHSYIPDSPHPAYDTQNFVITKH